MVDQLIKENIPVYIMLVFLDLYCERTNTGHVFNRDAYKRAALRGGVDRLTKSLREYYHVSKQYYLVRKHSFKTVATLMRQLCRHFQIPYATTIVYGGPKYSTVYMIYDRERVCR